MVSKLLIGCILRLMVRKQQQQKKTFKIETTGILHLLN